MFEYWTHTIAANTAETDRETVECKISPGILIDLSLYFPPGCHGLPKCRIFIGDSPVAPRSARAYLTGNATTLPILNIYEPIEGKLPILKWELWNADEENDHTIHLTAKWLTTEEVQAERTLLAGIYERISRLTLQMGGA